MEHVQVTSVEQLHREIVRFGHKSHLFRGQPNAYLDAHGTPTFQATFHRHGCVPLTTRKWTHYAGALIEHVSGGTIAPSLDLSSALLQHYGWRSFFLDATTEPAVAAWFASHSYAEARVATSLDQRHGGQIAAAQRVVTYARTLEAKALLYVFSADALASHGIGQVDLLERFSSLEARTRMSAQRAVLIGPLSGPLPPDAVVAQIEGPSSVLSEYAALQGPARQGELFPSRTEDPLLCAFLGLPWVKGPGGVYERSLSLPEYECPPPCPSPGEAYVARDIWVARDPPPPLANAVFLRVPELLLYANGCAEEPYWERLFDFVADCGVVVVEPAALWMDPRIADRPCYGKGLVARAIGEGLVEVGELVVEHTGTEVTGVAANAGYAYRLDEGQPSRVPSRSDCDCRSDSRHRHQVTMLSHVGGMLVRSELSRTGPLELSFRLDHGDT